MNTRSSARPGWVWASLALQFVLFSLTAQTCVRVIASWSKYMASGTDFQFVIRVFVPAALVVISLIGLWRNRRWGWPLALLANSALCVQDLWFLLDYGTFAVRNPRWLAFNVWEFAALAVLLCRPVRSHFLGRNGVPRRPTMSPGRVQTARVFRTVRPVRMLTYFVAAVVATCAATAFSLALWMGQKNGGSRGFLLFLYFGLVIGSISAFLFALVLTLLVRRLGSARLWLWLVAGGVLAPGLICGLGLIGFTFFPTGPVGVALSGAGYLFQVWWLTIPPGIFTGLICYAMYPWAFELG